MCIRDRIQDWLGPHSFYPQTGDNLGDRMRNAFQTGFQLGFEQLMIFGSDSPDIPLDTIEQGLNTLAQDGIAIGPSNDGGYYTLGFSQQSWCPEVFDGIQWSSESVYPETLKILRSQSAPLDILPTWDDIDTLADLQALYQRNLSKNVLPRTMKQIQSHLMSYLSGMPEA